MNATPNVDRRQRFTFLALIFVAGILSCGACNAGLLDEIRELNEELKTLNARVTRLDTEVQDGFRLALCHPEVRQLLDDVRNECNAIETCSTKMIHPAVMSADPKHKGRFLTFMSRLRHEAVYMRPSQLEFTKFRRERIERLATLPLLKNTTFLIVAHPVLNETNHHAEALRRAKLMAAKLSEYNKDINLSRIQIWIYSFDVSKADIENPADLPYLTEPTDLTRAVWVFRADC